MEDLPIGPDEYLARPHGRQWSLRVVLLWLAIDPEDGFWFTVAERSTKIDDDDSDRYLTEDSQLGPD
jgi:hypothetical protein